jgi:hypothetical protein
MTFATANGVLLELDAVEVELDKELPERRPLTVTVTVPTPMPTRNDETPAQNKTMNGPKNLFVVIPILVLVLVLVLVLIAVAIFHSSFLFRSGTWCM